MRPLLRVSLPDQVAASLREGISAARWVGELPGEMELCREFQVSRDTVRRALAQLVRERWITPGGRGVHHRIRRKPSARPAPAGRVIRVLSPLQLPLMGEAQNLLLATLSERLAAAGYRLEYEPHPSLFLHHQPRKLRDLDSLPETAGWALFYSTEAMQRWFATSGRPCVVVGRLHDAGFPLSCIYPHSEAAGRHAAGLFYGRGHRHLVYLLLDKPRSLGNRICADAFAAEATRLGATAEIVTHEGGRSTVLDLLKRLLAARPHPMGFFVSDFATSLTTLCYLIHKGYKVPEQAALICGWDDFCLQHTYPSIASYRADGVKLGRRLASSLLDLVQHGAGKVRAVHVLPEFVSGGSMVGE